MRRKGALYWLIFLLGFPILIFSVLNYIFSPSVLICWISILPGVLIFIVWSMFGHIFRKPTKKIDWEESESVEEEDKRKTTTEKYSAEDRTTEKDKSVFSRIFGREKNCDECGTEMVYKEGASSYYCPECREYKWKK